MLTSVLAAQLDRKGARGLTGGETKWYGVLPLHSLHGGLVYQHPIYRLMSVSVFASVLACGSNNEGGGTMTPAGSGGTATGVGGNSSQGYATSTNASGGATIGTVDTTSPKGGAASTTQGTASSQGGTTSATGGTTSSNGGTTSATGGTSSSSGGSTASVTTPVGAHGHLSVSGTHLVDQYGKNVQLKGISSQWLNLESDGYALSLDALVWMRDNWGLTVFRAAMGAEAAGTSPGYTTNATAQAEMQRQVELVINNAISAGVYVIVDWHAHNALTQQAAAVAFFGDLSKRYGQYPHVLFETFNEPLKVSWATALKPYHEAVVKAIRDNDPDTNANVAILGTPQWDQLPTEAAASPLTGKNLMYTVHFYSCDHNDTAAQPPFGDGVSNLQRARNALTAGLPLFVTEWGATKADGGVGGSAVCATQADAWHEWMNANQIGWTAWKLDDCDTEKPADTSCLLKLNAPLAGGWSDQLNGHGSYVIGKLKN